MEKGVNFILIGACFIASLVGLVIFIFWFGSSGDLSNLPKTYKAYSKNAINGVKIDSAIKYKGINIGRIKHINFKDNDFDEIVFEVAIRSDLPIKKDSILKVEQSGILGNSYLSLIQNENSNEFIESNQDAVLIIHTSAMSQILESMPNLTNKIDDLLSSANQVLSEENTNNITKILISIQDSANSINKIINSLQKNTDNIDTLIENVSQVSKNANDMINIVNQKIKHGEYDLKTTLTPALLSIEQSMNNINSLAKESASLVDNLKENPYNTIFGYRSEEKNDK